MCLSAAIHKYVDERGVPTGREIAKLQIHHRVYGIVH
jgi:hypothetical protein